MPNPTPYLDRLTHQYIDLIYAAALRRLHNDPHRAADITQTVLLVLLRKAEQGKLPREKYMAGWLIKITGYAILQQTRAAARRSHHESAAAYMNAQINPNESSATKLDDDIRNALDDSLLQLGATDREVLIRRHLQDQSLAQIGAAIGMQENTVGKRATRAMHKLRNILARRGITAPLAAISTLLAAEFSVKAPTAFALGSAASPAISSAISSAVKNLSWKLAMAKLKLAATLTLISLFFIAAATIASRAWFLRDSNPTNTAASPPASQPDAESLTWPATPPTITVSRIIDPPSDSILHDLLAGLAENQKQLRLIHVHAVDAFRWYDSSIKTFKDTTFTRGEAWLEAGPARRFRAEASDGQTRSIQDSGQLGPPKDATFIETWDGATGLREYRPPFSAPGGETFDRRYLKAQNLAGADFSMQLLWDQESASDQNGNGSHLTIDRNPLDPTVLAKMNLRARRVELHQGQIAMELTVNIPDPPQPDPQVRRVQIFWFDPQRGYALLARRNSLFIANAELMRQTYVIESLIEAAPGIYYPAKAQMLLEQRGTSVLWENFAASQAIANETFDPSQFHLTFTPGIQIYDFNNGIGTNRKPTPTTTPTTTP